MGILVTSCHINSIEFRLFAATCICCPVAQDVVHQHVEWHSKQTLIEGPDGTRDRGAEIFSELSQLWWQKLAAVRSKCCSKQALRAASLSFFGDLISHAKLWLLLYDSQEMFGTWNSEINCHDWTFSLDFLKNQIKHLLSDAEDDNSTMPTAGW